METAHRRLKDSPWIDVICVHTLRRGGDYFHRCRPRRLLQISLKKGCSPQARKKCCGLKDLKQPFQASRPRDSRQCYQSARLWPCCTMAAHQKPLPSATGGLAFSRLPSDEIKKISVKQIHVTPALDSMFGPIPGGVHDLALGAISALDAK